MYLSGPALKRVHLAVFVLLLAALSFVSLLYFPFTLEDAYVTFRYARNLASGHPLGTWNVGEAPVEGFSSPLWTLLLSVPFHLHISPFHFGKLVGYCCALGMPISTYVAYRLLLRRRAADVRDPVMFGCASLLLAANVPIFYYGVAGTETVFFGLQVLLMLIVPLCSKGRLRVGAVVLLSAALVLTRLEGLLFALLISGFWAFSTNDKGVQASGSAGLATTLSIFSLLTWYRIHCFHELLPTSFVASSVGGPILHRVVLGARYEAHFAIFVMPGLIVLALCGYLGWKQMFGWSFGRLLVLVTVSNFLYVLLVGGDAVNRFPAYRQFVPIAGSLAFLLAAAISRSVFAAQNAYFVAMVAAVSMGLWVVFLMPPVPLQPALRISQTQGWFAEEAPLPVTTWFVRYSSAKTLFAAAGAGELAYRLPGRFLDLNGLNDAEIARSGTLDSSSHLADGKTNMLEALSRRPDILEGYMDAEPILRGLCPDFGKSDRGLMLHELLASAIFRNEYVFVVNGPYKNWDRAVFFRRSYLDYLGARELMTAAVTETSLYGPDCR